MKLFPISGKFLATIKNLSWHDYDYAYKMHLIDLSAFIDIALWKIEHEKNYPDEVLQLAGESASNSYIVENLVENIVKNEEPIEINKEKWVYLSLLWLYNNKESFNSLRDEIDMIYCEFDHPKSIEHLVSYMPFEGEVRELLPLLEEFLSKSEYASLHPGQID